MIDWKTLEALPWIVFFLVWVVSALFTKRTVRRAPLAERIGYLAPFLLAGVLLFTGRFAGVLPVRVLPATNLVRAIGLALTTAGIAFAIWARFHLGRLWSGSITLKEGHRLVQSGPYRITRHPIYTGLLVAILGRAVGDGTVRAFAAVALAAIAIVIKLSFEERLMAESFGEEHAAYRRRVKTLMPFVW